MIEAGCQTFLSMLFILLGFVVVLLLAPFLTKGVCCCEFALKFGPRYPKVREPLLEKSLILKAHSLENTLENMQVVCSPMVT